jgi:hypothetical protein
VAQMMKGKILKEKSKKEEKDFTRERKIGFVSLICLIINMVRKSTQLELDEFREKFMPESAKNTTYTKQAFSEARQKLSPRAFTLLSDELIQGFYEDDDYKKYKGFRLLAIDGMVVEIPNNKETQKQYGFVSNGDKSPKMARALSSQLMDIENKLVVSSTLGRCDASERDLAKINIEHILPWKTPYSRDLILFDRGYPSASLIHYLQTNRVHFLMRVSSSFYKEVNNTATPDEWVEIVITKEKAKELEKQGTPIPVGTVLKVRVIKVELSTGEIETLITDLSAEEISYEECKALYFKRWGIETRYDQLKNQFEIENFSGVTTTVIEQDFYATILLSNMASLIEQDALEEMQKKNAHKTLKYDEYKINHNILVGKLKNNLVEIILEEDDAKKDEMFQRLIAELERNIIAVIPGRSFKREKKSKANKYNKSKRRSL